MKIKLILFFSILINAVLAGIFIQKIRSNWFEQGVLKLPFRTAIFEGAPKHEGLIYFIGDSHTEGFELNEYLQNGALRNRGVWGDVSGSVLKRIDSVAIVKPKKVFIMVGVNDIMAGLEPKDIAGNMEKIVSRIHTLSPQTKIYIESVLPTDKEINRTKESSESNIVKLNKLYKSIAAVDGVTYIDLHPYFVEHGALKKAYSYDGLHMNGHGYSKWSELVKPYLP
jgi:lysophospholipase L1-like esterase